MSAVSIANTEKWINDLRSTNPVVRREAAHELVKAKANTPRALSALFAVTSQFPTDVAGSATPKERAAVSLEGEAWVAAYQALMTLEPSHAMARELYFQSLLVDNPPEEVLEAIAESESKLKVSSLDDVSAALSHPNEAVRASAAHLLALHKLATPTVVATIDEILSQPDMRDPVARFAVTRAMEKLGPHASLLTESLRHRIKATLAAKDIPRGANRMVKRYLQVHKANEVNAWAETLVEIDPYSEGTKKMLQTILRHNQAVNAHTAAQTTLDLIGKLHGKPPADETMMDTIHYREYAKVLDIFNPKRKRSSLRSKVETISDYPPARMEHILNVLSQELATPEAEILQKEIVKHGSPQLKKVAAKITWCGPDFEAL